MAKRAGLGVVCLGIGVCVALGMFYLWLVNGTADRPRAVAGVFGVAAIAGMFYWEFDLLHVVWTGCTLLIGVMVFKTSWQGGHLEYVCWAVALGGSVDVQLAGASFPIRAGVMAGSVAFLYLVQACAKSPISYWLSNEKSKRKRQLETACSTHQIEEAAVIHDHLTGDEEELPY